MGQGRYMPGEWRLRAYSDHLVRRVPLDCVPSLLRDPYTFETGTEKRVPQSGALVPLLFSVV